MNKIIGKHKLLSLVIALFMALALVPAAPVAVKAESAADYVTLTRNNSTNENGNFYMNFTVKNINVRTASFSAKVVNSAGKQVFSWGSKQCSPNQSLKLNYGGDYRSLPSGKYTLILSCFVGQGASWTWSYGIKHTRKESFAFKSYQKVNNNGKLMHQWNIQCTNLKGQKLTMKIYDPNGQLVYNETGPARKSGNEVGWFSWNGWVGKKFKCPSGTYLVQVTVAGSNKVVEKNYNLNIN